MPGACACLDTPPCRNFRDHLSFFQRGAPSQVVWEIPQPCCCVPLSGRWRLRYRGENVNAFSGTSVRITADGDGEGGVLFDGTVRYFENGVLIFERRIVVPNSGAGNRCEPYGLEITGMVPYVPSSDPMSNAVGSGVEVIEGIASFGQWERLGTCSVFRAWGAGGPTSNQEYANWEIESTFIPGDQCSPDCFACCVGGGCLNTNAATCAVLQGQFFDGNRCGDRGVLCANENIGACCRSGQPCTLTSGEECDAAGGLFFLGQPCPFVCNALGPFGACCKPDGTCFDGVNVSTCTSAGGTFQGAGTDCLHTTCGGPSLGACCKEAGSCVLRTNQQCAIEGGVWRGPGTDCATPCPFGGCCKPDGTCANTTPWTCEALFGGTYLGDGIMCDSRGQSGCFGACCVKGNCVQTTIAGCAAAGGNWMGLTPCGPGLCVGKQPARVPPRQPLPYPKSLWTPSRRIIVPAGSGCSGCGGKVKAGELLP